MINYTCVPVGKKVESTVEDILPTNVHFVLILIQELTRLALGEFYYPHVLHARQSIESRSQQKRLVLSA